ncbi:unnamed protein product [Amoebophrya sp. A120]|nr:unnamed protein product [Amoebophrya sp. A120]|eukprot:GSA120T00003530001.1
MPASTAASSQSVAPRTTGEDADDSREAKKKTFSDLLLKSGNTTFELWLSSLEAVEENTRATRYQQLVVGAMVNSWQFGCLHANRRKVEEGGEKAVVVILSRDARLPLDVVHKIRFLIGEVEKHDFCRITPMADLQQMSNIQRGRDLKAAADYFVDLARKAAESGGSMISITEAQLQAMPKMSDGATIHFGNVCAILKEKGYDFMDAEGTWFGIGDIFDHGEFPARGPVVMQFHGMNASDFDPLFSCQLARDFERGQGLYRSPTTSLDSANSSSLSVSMPRTAGAGTPLVEINRVARTALGLGPAPAPTPRPQNRFLAAFEESLRRTQAEMLKYITDLAFLAFSNAEPRFVLTEEIYNAPPARHLPSGAPYPMFRHHVEQMHPDRSGAAYEEFGLFPHLAKVPGLNVRSEEINGARAWPVTIGLSLGTQQQGGV